MARDGAQTESAGHWQIDAGFDMHWGLDDVAGGLGFASVRPRGMRNVQNDGLAEVSRSGASESAAFGYFSR